MSDFITTRDLETVHDYKPGHKPLQPIMQKVLEVWHQKDTQLENLFAWYQKGKISEYEYANGIMGLTAYDDLATNLMMIQQHNMDCTCSPNDPYMSCWVCEVFKHYKMLIEGAPDASGY